MTRARGPLLARWLLESVLPVSYGEALLGDLLEEYGHRAGSTSRAAASIWFWGHVWRSVPWLMRSSFDGAEWASRLAAALSVYALMVSVKLAVNVIVSKLAGLEGSVHLAMEPVLFVAVTAAGGCIADRIRRGTTMLLALMVIITVAVLIWIQLCTTPVPWWYPCIFLSLGPLSVVVTPAVFYQSQKAG